ncbi:hypothetical protein IFM89_033976 [Coptis chinensis]|uniref:ELM2 domain-containing protein n=1 Tax=Coptis chinensis TaxID=261450 RepID=A0A835HLP0_9MAGN|nr:hypothetical protein IFM89_033976 [Coptis chinensis]
MNLSSQKPDEFSEMLYLLKYAAIDPCNLELSTKKWGRLLKTKKVLILNYTDIPWKKRKFHHLLQETSTVTCCLPRKKPNKQNLKRLEAIKTSVDPSTLQEASLTGTTQSSKTIPNNPCNSVVSLKSTQDSSQGDVIDSSATTGEDIVLISDSDSEDIVLISDSDSDSTNEFNKLSCDRPVSGAYDLPTKKIYISPTFQAIPTGEGSTFNTNISEKLIPNSINPANVSTSKDAVLISNSYGDSTNRSDKWSCDKLVSQRLDGSVRLLELGYDTSISPTFQANQAGKDGSSNESISQILISDSKDSTDISTGKDAMPLSESDTTNRSKKRSRDKLVSQSSNESVRMLELGYDFPTKQRSSSPKLGETRTSSTNISQILISDSSNSRNISSLKKAARRSVRLMNFIGDHLERQPIPVGDHFQANIPECIGPPGEDYILSSSKWLGEKIWPIEGGKIVIDTKFIGKGRSDSICYCEFPDSLECIKSHIFEERLRIRSEIGDAFYSWGFDKMGEAVSESWTLKEQNDFEKLFQTNSLSIKKNFWSRALKCLPSKSRENIISYYFNVFSIRYTSYQDQARLPSPMTDGEIGEVDDSVPRSKASISKRRVGFIE